MIRLFTTAACLTLATPVAVAAPANFTPGLWETSITFSVLEQSNTDATTGRVSKKVGIRSKPSIL